MSADVPFSIMPANANRRSSESIKALSIAQPWAELTLRRRKPYEIRSWKTDYRGPLLIHASTKFWREPAVTLGIVREDCAAGAFVGWAELMDVRPFTRRDAIFLKQKKGGTGWWEPDQFAWVLRGVHRIDPIPFKGRLNLFSPPLDIARLVDRAFARRR